VFFLSFVENGQTQKWRSNTGSPMASRFPFDAFDNSSRFAYNVRNLDLLTIGNYMWEVKYVEFISFRLGHAAVYIFCGCNHRCFRGPRAAEALVNRQDFKGDIEGTEGKRWQVTSEIN